MFFGLVDGITDLHALGRLEQLCESRKHFLGFKWNCLAMEKFILPTHEPSRVSLRRFPWKTANPEGRDPCGERL